MITQEKAVELINKYKETNDENILMELINKSKPLIMKDYKILINGTYTEDDLMQDFSIILLKKIKQYDENKANYSTWLHYISLSLYKNIIDTENYELTDKIIEKTKYLHYNFDENYISKCILIDELKKTLTIDEYLILCKYYGIGCIKKNVQDITKEQKITRKTLSLIIAKSLRKLRGNEHITREMIE